MPDLQQDYTIDYYKSLAKNSTYNLMREATAVVESYNKLNDLFTNVDGKNVHGKPVITYAKETQTNTQAARVKAKRHHIIQVIESHVAMEAVTAAAEAAVAAADQAESAREVGGMVPVAARDVYDAAVAESDEALKTAKAAAAEAEAAAAKLKRLDQIATAAAEVLAAVGKVATRAAEMGQSMAAVLPAASPRAAATATSRKDNMLTRDYNPGGDMKYGGPVGTQDQPRHRRRKRKNKNNPRTYSSISSGGGTNTKKYRRRNKRKTKHYKKKAKRYTKKRNMHY
jgi:hypothetical protein